jgi:murein DD-endopeptidase MepM/ murein hydrolase activator NlpD
MSRFAPGIRRGAKVSQGQVIGYVGSTGWSTGAHLHYEFRVGGEARDPSKVAVVAQAPLSPAELARFRTVSSDMLHRFALLRPNGAPSPTFAAR